MTVLPIREVASSLVLNKTKPGTQTLTQNDAQKMIQVDNFADFLENYIQLDHIVDELGKDSIVVDFIHVMKVTTR